MECSSKGFLFLVPKYADTNSGLFIRCLGEGLTVKVIKYSLILEYVTNIAFQIATEVLRAVFDYDDLRRAPGQSGRLNRYTFLDYCWDGVSFLDL